MAVTDLGQLGGGSATSAATTLAVTNTSGATIPIGTLLHVCGTWDSINSATAPTITCSTIGGATAIAGHATAPGSGATTTAGAGIWHQCFRAVTTATIAAGATICTLTSNQSAVKRVAVVRGLQDCTSTLRNTVATGASTSGAPSATTAGTALAAADAVLGSISYEDNAAPTDDTDTTNGSWSAGISTFTTGGSAVTNVGVSQQVKFVTATGAQTFNPVSGGDSVACVFALVPAAVTAQGAATLTQNSSMSAAGTEVIAATATMTQTSSLSAGVGRTQPSGITGLIGWWEADAVLARVTELVTGDTSSFEGGTGNWSLIDSNFATKVVSTDFAYSGLQSLKLVADASGLDQTIQTKYGVGDFYPVTAGQPHTVSGKILSTVARNVSAAIWYYSSESLAADVTVNPYGAAVASAVGSFGRHQYTSVAPAGATHARFGFYFSGPALGNTFYVDDVRFGLGYSDGDRVEVTDKSSAGNNLVNATVSARPILKTSILNGQPSLRFAGTEVLRSAAAMPAGAVTIMILASYDYSSGDKSVYSSADGGAGDIHALLGSPGNAAILAYGGNNGFAETGLTFPLSARINTIDWNNVGSTSIAYNNGSTGNSISTNATSTTRNFVFGGESLAGGSPSHIGDIFLALHWNRVLSAAERAQMHSWIQDKYGIAVADYVPAAVVLRTAVAAATLTQTSTLSGTGTVTGGGGGVTQQGAASLSQSSSMSATAVLDQPATATLTQTSTMSAVALPIRLGTVNLSQTSILSVNGVREQPAVATMTQTSTANIAAVRIRLGDATLIQTSTINVSGLEIAVATANLMQTNTLSAQPVGGTTAQGTATLTQSSTLSTVALPIRLGAATLTATSVLVAGAFTVGIAAASLAAPTTLSATAFALRPSSATLTQANTLSADAVGVTVKQGTATLLQTNAMSTVSWATEFGAATLVQTSTFSALADRLRIADATMTQNNTMSLSALRIRLGDPILAQSSVLNVSADRQTFASATLTQTSVLVANVGSFATLQGTATLTNTNTMSAAGWEQQFGSAALTQNSIINISGARTAVAAATLTQTNTLSATIFSAVTASATLSQPSVLSVSTFTLVSGTATLTQPSTINVSGERIRLATATMAQTNTMSVAVGAIRIADAALSQTSLLAVSSTALRLAAVIMSQPSALSVGSLIVAFAPATLVAQSMLSVSADRFGPYVPAQTPAVAVIVDNAGQSTVSGGVATATLEPELATAEIHWG